MFGKYYNSSYREFFVLTSTSEYVRVCVRAFDKVFSAVQSSALTSNLFPPLCFTSLRAIKFSTGNYYSSA